MTIEDRDGVGISFIYFYTVLSSRKMLISIFLLEKSLVVNHPAKVSCMGEIRWNLCQCSQLNGR